MAEFFYTTGSERQTLITERENLGETMLSDDFNVDPRGENRLTFGIIPDPVPTPDEVRLTELHGRLKAQTMTLPEIIEMLKLERGL